MHAASALHRSQVHVSEERLSDSPLHSQVRLFSRMNSVKRFWRPMSNHADGWNRARHPDVASLMSNTLKLHIRVPRFSRQGSGYRVGV